MQKKKFRFLPQVCNEDDRKIFAIYETFKVLLNLKNYGKIDKSNINNYRRKLCPEINCGNKILCAL